MLNEISITTSFLYSSFFLRLLIEKSLGILYNTL